VYTIEVSNACGTFGDSFALHIDEDLCNCTAFVPNIFSPNGDGTNDEFEIITECTPAQYDLQVFDRWGELMFQSSDPSLHWPGLSPIGRPCAAGVYYYVLSYESIIPTEGTKRMKGTVTLLR
jgi:gliding motility-associated-like protein